MKKIIMPVFLIFTGIATMSAATTVITVSNPSSLPLKAVPVSVSVDRFHVSKIVSAAVYVSQKQIPSQLDDLNHDGKADELAFMVDLRPQQKLTVTVKLASDSSLFKPFTERTHAQMWRKDKQTKDIVPTVEESSSTGNLYQNLHHHGPAIESEYMAYRLYFDEKQTVDIYGKKKHRLELADTKWYPTDKQLEEGYGDDILWVKATAGCGTLKGWNGSEAVHISPVSNRTGRVLASGPVRSIIEMQADGWLYEGKKIDIRQRFTIYAGHRDLEVQVYQNQADSLCAGVQTFFDSSEPLTTVKGAVAIWGTGLQYPVTDNPRTKPQTVGLAVSVPLSAYKKHISDKDNLLLLLAGQNFTYHLAAAWEQEEGGFKTAKDFFAYVKDWNKKMQIAVNVSVK
jgi:hypothetical protein